jgi:mRNA-degrading endonuclease YafQ of YafQ-DinJ toxin-antitoxin module
MLDFYFINQFKKDLKLAIKRRYDIDAIYNIGPRSNVTKFS